MKNKDITNNREEELKYYVYKTEDGVANVSKGEKKELGEYLLKGTRTMEEAQKVLLEYILRPDRKYRLGYDYVFLPKNSFKYKGDLIGSMSIIVLFKVYDMKGNEFLFKSKGELIDQQLDLQNGFSYYLCHLFNCYFDKEIFKQKNIFRFLPRVNMESSKYRVEMEIVDYTKDIGDAVSEPEIIKKEEFIDIISNNLELFDVSDNKPAQSTSYITEEVLEIKDEN